ncbi:MAG: hypothetical protein ACFE9Z_04765 [Promethearchaeota archaeon]
MKVSVPYDEILEESLKDELTWLLEEFQIIFNPKIDNYTEKEKEIANNILDYLLDHSYAYENTKFYKLLIEVIQNIEKIYPGLL